MDFVDWCGLVLEKVVEAARQSSYDHSIGVPQTAVAALLFGDATMVAPEYWESEQRNAMRRAFGALMEVGWLEEGGLADIYVRPTRESRVGRTDPFPFWERICAEALTPDEEQVLGALNRLGVQGGDDHVLLKAVTGEQLLKELRWSHEADRLRPTARDLTKLGFAWLNERMDSSMQLAPTYRGLVRETRRGLTVESRSIDALVAEWETTSVDFKREVHTTTADEKAELVKDLLGLANTQASGRRWLIIGFDDKTRTYHGPPDPKLTQNHIEQLMAQYTTPAIDLRYDAVDYRMGRVGKLEILRDARKLPYCVAKSVGNKGAGGKRRITMGQVFVRHGSQTEEPTPAERQAIQDEGDRARAMP